MMKALNSYYQHRHTDKTAYGVRGKGYNINDCNNINKNDINEDDQNNNRNDVMYNNAEKQKMSLRDNSHASYRNATLLRDILATDVEVDNDERDSDLGTSKSVTETSETNGKGRVQIVYDDDKNVSRIWAQDKKAETSKRNNRNQKLVGSSRRNLKTSDHNQRPSSSMSSNEHEKMFKMARCRLIYNDEPEKKPKTKKTRPKSSSWTERASRMAEEASSGVLVDSVGHVYGQSKPRPWSALPCKFSAFLKDVNKNGGALNVDRRYRDFFQDTLASSLKDFSEIVGENTSDSGISHGRYSTTSTGSKDNNNNLDSHLKADQQKVNVVTVHLPAEDMDKSTPIATKAVAFNRRNRTTHYWSDSPSMSQSLPNASFLHKQFTTSPPPFKTRGPSPSRAGKPSKTRPDRPSSSYSYDGGFFLGAHSTGADYFVIHPDWVSEALTINKMGPCGSPDGAKQAQMAKLKLPQRRWSERRCLSAPPSKFRNPLSWEDTDVSQYQSKKNKF